MSKSIIITCGTSILNSKILKDNADLINKIDQIGEGDYKEAFIDFYSKNNYSLMKSCKKTKDYGAEINTLKNIYKSGDSIYFYFSETNGGEIVKEILSGYLKTEYAGDLLNYNFNDKISFCDENEEGKEIYFRTIQNFKVDSASDFKNAIPYFYSQLESIKEKHGDQEIIMAPVGGYKALIPYASLYAMVNGWDIEYIYEDSDEMIGLPSGALGYLIMERGLTNDFKNLINYDFLNELNKINISSNDILKLIEATNNFSNNGDLSGFKNLNMKYGPITKITTKLYELNLYIKTLGLRKGKIQDIIKEIDNITSNNVLFSIFDKIKSELYKFNINGNDLEFYFSCLEFYHEKERYVEEFLFFREFLIDIYQYYIYDNIGPQELKHPTRGVNEKGKETSIKKDIRIYLEGSINHQISGFEKDETGFYYLTNIADNDFKKTPSEENEISKISSGFIDKNDLNKLQILRNDIAHILKPKYYDKFKEVIKQNKINKDDLEGSLRAISEYYFKKLESFKNHILELKKENTTEFKPSK